MVFEFTLIAGIKQNCFLYWKHMRLWLCYASKSYDWTLTFTWLSLVIKYLFQYLLCAMYYAIFITWFPWYSRFLRSGEHSLYKQGLGSWLIAVEMTWMLTIYALRASTACPQGKARLWACHHTAWCIAQGRQLYGIMITSFCNEGSCYQRRYGGSSNSIYMCKTAALPRYPSSHVTMKTMTRDSGETPPPNQGVFGSSIRDRCVTSPSKATLFVACFFYICL